ncbi:HTH CENPB-type domain-containing protein [Favolaschia claudopus]|uniref:HTH CENPB-type domain-containing protein n=1 Tax=Favolaschia claudopus TaxID=2862362 RepID=A0AAW0A420_9AGAR
MMAPSRETSVRGHLPLPPNTPVRVMTDMLYRARERAKKVRLDRGSDSDEEDGAPESPTPQGDNPSPPRRRRIPGPNPFDTPVRNAITSLQGTSSAFLFSSSPVRSSSDPPANPTTEISPEKPENVFLLEREPATSLEGELQAALREALEKNVKQKRQMVAMQSALVLNGTYVDLVRGQLEAQEKKKSRGNKKGRLVSDGMPRLLTARDFVQRVTEFERDTAEKAEALKQRKATREERGEALKDWKALEEKRKARNKEIRLEHATRVLEWEAERDLAKQQHRRPGWKKPSIKGLLFSPLPKPGYAVEPGEKTVEPDSDDDGIDPEEGDGKGSDSDSSSSSSEDGGSNGSDN